MKKSVLMMVAVLMMVVVPWMVYVLGVQQDSKHASVPSGQPPAQPPVLCQEHVKHILDEAAPTTALFTHLGSSTANDATYLVQLNSSLGELSRDAREMQSQNTEEDEEARRLCLGFSGRVFDACGELASAVDKVRSRVITLLDCTRTRCDEIVVQIPLQEALNGWAAVEESLRVLSGATEPLALLAAADSDGIQQVETSLGTFVKELEARALRPYKMDTAATNAAGTTMLLGIADLNLQQVPWKQVISRGASICAATPVAIAACSTVAVLAIGTTFVYETSGYTHVNYTKVWQLGTLTGELSRASSDISDIEKTLRQVERLPEKLGDSKTTDGDLRNDVYAITDGVMTETKSVFTELRDAATDAATMWDSYEEAHASYETDKTNWNNCWWFCGSKPLPPRKPLPENAVDVLNKLVGDASRLEGRLTAVLDCAQQSCDLDVLAEELKEAEQQDEAMKLHLQKLTSQICGMQENPPPGCLGIADLGVASLSKPPVSYVGDDAPLAVLAGAALVALAAAAVSTALRRKPAQRGVPLLQ